MENIYKLGLLPQAEIPPAYNPRGLSPRTLITKCEMHL